MSPISINSIVPTFVLLTTSLKSKIVVKLLKGLHKYTECIQMNNLKDGYIVHIEGTDNFFDRQEMACNYTTS